jgi:ribosomal protein S18 acetylase RimI-like enzyme
LAADPVANTVSLTVLSAVVAGRRWSDDPLLFAWHEDGGAVLMTPPHELLLARVPDGTLEGLVAAVRDRGVAIPGVNGETGVAERFAAAWRGEHAVFLRLRLYALGTLVPPDPPPPGAARPARDDELDLAARWLAAFEEETGVTRTDARAGARERGEDGRLWLWEDADGRPVSLAARTPTAVGVARIAPVYTPPEHRRHGYGAAITAACSLDALERDADHVVLFADADNPTTNAIYQQIGFRPVSDWCTIRFSG